MAEYSAPCKRQITVVNVPDIDSEANEMLPWLEKRQRCAEETSGSSVSDGMNTYCENETKETLTTRRKNEKIRISEMRFAL